LSARKTVAFVPVRLNSTRLPGKHFEMIGDHSLLSWVIKRLKDVNQFDDIVICAPNTNASQVLNGFADGESVNLFLYDGNENDVVGRLVSAAKIYEAEICVLASGDCPLLSSSSISRLISAIKNSPDVGIASFSRLNNRRPIHEGVLVSVFEVWNKADRLSDTAELREHQFPAIWKKPDLFRDYGVAHIADDAIFYQLQHRISIDTPADLAFHKALYSVLKEKSLEYNLANVIELALSHPGVLDTNRNVRQKSLEDVSCTVAIFLGKDAISSDNVRRRLNVFVESLINQIGVGVEIISFDADTLERIKIDGIQAKLLQPNPQTLKVLLSPYRYVGVFGENSDQRLVTGGSEDGKIVKCEDLQNLDFT